MAMLSVSDSLSVWKECSHGQALGVTELQNQSRVEGYDIYCVLNKFDVINILSY